MDVIIGTPGGVGMVNRFVHVAPRSVECHNGAFGPQPPEKAVITTSFGLTGFMARVGSVSPAMSVLVSAVLVLLTTTSRMKIGAVASEEIERRIGGSCLMPGGGGVGVGVAVTTGFKSSGMAGLV